MKLSQQNTKADRITGGTVKSISGENMFINKCCGAQINIYRSTFKGLHKQI